jgi:AbrB family looped-hinge helix DNA binding protein
VTANTNKRQIDTFAAFLYDQNMGPMDTHAFAYKTHLEKSGRILIPVAVRRRLGLSEGSQVIVKVEESGALQIASRSQAVARVRERIRKFIPAGQDLVEKLIRDRRAEAEREDQEAHRS